MKDTSAEKNAVGVKIIPLRETIFLQEKIVRLGPPPDNAGILIRGGMAWVLGILTKPIPTDPRIVRLQEPEPLDQVMVAMWRELAYQWVHQRGTFAELNGNSKRVKASNTGSHPLDYPQIERQFVANAGALWPGGREVPEAASSMNTQWTPGNQDVVTVLDKENSCSCSIKKKCCSASCSSCESKG